MVNPIPFPTPRAPISTDLHCIHCQYNLRTRTPADRCPECGNSVADSLAHYKLHERAIAAPPAVRAAAWCFAVPCLLSLASFVALSFFKQYVIEHNTQRLIVSEALLRQAVHLFFAAMLFAGTVMLCGAVSNLIARPGTRLALVMITGIYAAINFLIFVSVSALLTRPGGRAGRLIFALMLVRNQRIGAAIVCVALAAAGWAIMRRLAQSISSPRIRSASNLIFPALLADGVLSLLFYLALGTWRLNRNAFPFDGLFTAMDLGTAVILTGFGGYWLVVARVVREKLPARPGGAEEMVAAARPAEPAGAKIEQFLSRRKP